jgi:hypothetical protein
MDVMVILSLAAAICFGAAVICSSRIGVRLLCTPFFVLSLGYFFLQIGVMTQGRQDTGSFNANYGPSLKKLTGHLNSLMEQHRCDELAEALRQVGGANYGGLRDERFARLVDQITSRALPTSRNVLNETKTPNEPREPTSPSAANQR